MKEIYIFLAQMAKLNYRKKDTVKRFGKPRLIGLRKELM